jgi:hypothetical protein
MADIKAHHKLYHLWAEVKAEGNSSEYTDEMCTQLELFGTESNGLTRQAIHDKLEKVLTKIKATL